MDSFDANGSPVGSPFQAVPSAMPSLEDPQYFADSNALALAAQQALRDEQERILAGEPRESTTGEQIRQHHEADHYRRNYRQLSPEKVKLVSSIKEQAEFLHLIIEMAPQGRQRDMALTKLEECVMWVVKAIT